MDPRKGETGGLKASWEAAAGRFQESRTARPGVEDNVRAAKYKWQILGLWKKKGANVRPGNPGGAITVPSTDWGRR